MPFAVEDPQGRPQTLTQRNRGVPGSPPCALPFRQGQATADHRKVGLHPIAFVYDRRIRQRFLRSNMPRARTPHLFALTPPSVWAWLLKDNGGVPLRYVGKLLPMLVATTLATPLRLWQHARFSSSLVRTKPHPPLFVVGYPRSGTTHLHNLLFQDAQFGSVTNYQAAVPTFWLAGGDALKHVFARLAPATRPMDNVRVGMDMPQEEEFAIANSCHVSWLHHFTFPSKALEYFNKFAMMSGLSASEMTVWEQTFLNLVQQATLVHNGKRLVLKNPTNTGRIQHLLRIFPDAQFIHIVRNPFVVFKSMLHLYRRLIPIHQLQPAELDQMVEVVIETYRTMMQQLLEDKKTISKDRFVEIRFEQLEDNAICEMGQIYSALGIQHWNEAKPRVATYMQSISSYRKNEFQIDQATVDRLSREWAFALDAWDYKEPQRNQPRHFVPGSVGGR